MSLNEPDSTDRNIPLGEQHWNTVPVFTIDPVFTATDLSFVDDDDVDTDVVKAVDAGSTSVTSVFSVADVHVVAVDPTIVDAAGFEDVCHSITDSLFAVKEGELEGAALSIRR